MERKNLLVPHRLINRIRAPLSAAAAMLVCAAAPAMARGAAALPAGASDCRLCAIAGRIEREPIERVVRGLSGADSVTIGGARRLIRTRSTLHPGKELAREYLLELASGLGYDPRLRWFVLSISYPDFQGAALSAAGDTLWAGTHEGDIRRFTAGAESDAGLAGSVGARVYDLGFDHDDVLWAACKTFGSGYGELHYSSDRGATWTPLLVGGPANSVHSLSSVVFGGPETGLAAGAWGTLVRLRRLDEEWFATSVDPAVFFNRNINGAAAGGPQRFWVVADGGALFESSDSGRSWEARALTTRRLWDVDFFDAARGVIVGDNVAFHTADSGRTWHAATVAASLVSVKMFDSLTVFAAGGGGVILRSGDGGAAWAPFDLACESAKDIRRLVLDRGHRRAWAVGRNELRRFDPGDANGPCAVTAVADTIKGANIVFSRPGLVEPQRTVVLCAHYDAVNFLDPSVAPGADDNASGTAAVLEAARALRTVSLERTIEFIFFDGEEIGLLGSRHHVGALPAGAAPEAVINIDMIGRDYGGGVRVEIAGRGDGPDTALAALIDGTIGMLGLDLEPNFLTSRSPTSDHKSFWELEGVPAVMLVEGSYWENPYYHRGSDVADNIDFEYVTDIARAAAASAARLAGLIGTEPLPDAVVLHPIFPNPSWGHATVAWSLPRRMFVAIRIYDPAGRLVRTLARGEREAGPGVEVWYGRNDGGRPVASGVYFLRFDAGGAAYTRKIVMLR